MPRRCWISPRSLPGQSPDRPLRRRRIPPNKINEPALLPLLRIRHGGVRHGADLLELDRPGQDRADRSEEHTSELQSPDHLVCRLLLEKKKIVESRLSTTETSH